MNATFEHIQQDHKELHHQLTTLHRVLCERHQSRDEVVKELTRLHDHLAEHFLNEEQTGFFDNLLQRMPHHATPINTLQREHGERLRDLEKLIQDAREQLICPEWWEDLARRFHEVSRLLMSHELREDALLREAYGCDLGGME